MVDGDDDTNLNQMMETVLEDGYLYAQGYVEGADEGDMRIFLLDGEPIEADEQSPRFGACRRAMTLAPTSAPAEGCNPEK